MKQDFRIASLMDLRLPRAQKERLWREKIVRHASVMDLISTASRHFVSNERDAKNLVDDVLQVNKMIEEHARNFFSYRTDIAPPEVYYATMGRTYIQLQREYFTHLPETYAALEDQLDTVDSIPSSI